MNFHNPEMPPHSEAVSTAQVEIEKVKEQRSEMLLQLQNPDTRELVEQVSYAKDAHTVSENDNKNFVYFEKGNSIEISEADILLASEWGMDLKIGTDPALRNQDHKESDNLSSLKERFVNHEAKKRIKDISYEHMARKEASESYNNNQGINPYDYFVERIDREDYELEPGLLTEKMIRTTLAKLAHEHNLPFTVEESNPVEDIDFKIDMLIKFDEGYLRGLQIAEKRDVGVQLTASTNRDTLQKKEGQMEYANKQLQVWKSDAADDVVLVSLGINDEVKDAYNEWRQNEDGSYKSLKRCSPKGPEQFLSEQTKIAMIESIVAKLPSQLEKAGEDILQIVSEKLV